MSYMHCQTALPQRATDTTQGHLVSPNKDLGTEAQNTMKGIATVAMQREINAVLNP